MLFDKSSIFVVEVIFRINNVVNSYIFIIVQLIINIIIKYTILVKYEIILPMHYAQKNFLVKK